MARATRSSPSNRDEAGCKQHLEMGFHEGWGLCTDQLVALVEAQARR